MAQGTFSGPIRVGTIKEGSASNLGGVVLAKQVAFVPAASITTATDGNGITTSTYHGIPATAWALTTTATAALASIELPVNSSLVDIVYDQPVATTGGTAINATIGATAGGVEYAPSADLKTITRLRPTLTTTQLVNWDVVAASPLQMQVVPTVSPVTAGVLIATISYIQK